MVLPILIGSYFYQNFNVVNSENISFSFDSAQRVSIWQSSFQQFNVLLDSKIIGYFVPTTDGVYHTYSTNTVSISAGLHTLSFVGINANGSDNSVFIDHVQSNISAAGPVGCGPGVPLTTGTGGVGALWQMLALPCVPATSTIAGVLGTGTPSNLNTAHYATATPGIGWIIEDRPVSAVPAYRPLLINDILNVGTGYWLKSYQAPTKGILTMNGAATPTDTTQAQGCYSANGCKAITVTTVTGNNRYNLVGNPFPYAIDWTKVRIRVDGSSSTLTPSAANTAGYIDNTVNIWNGTGYDTFTDVAPYPSTPNLQYFKSFWINVLPKAFGHTVELLIPAEQSTQQILGLNQVVPPVEQVAKLAMPWYLGWLDGVVSPAAAATVPTVSNPINPQSLSNPNDWSIRLKVDNSVTGWKDHGALLGQLHDAALGFDKHDVAKMAPFAAPYLTLVFPHPDWGVKAADYASDFHAVSNTVDNWRFEIRANPVGSTVFLSWEGNPALLKRSRLLDVATNTTIDPNDPRWQNKGYPIILNTAVKAYVWKVLAQ